MFFFSYGDSWTLANGVVLNLSMDVTHEIYICGNLGHGLCMSPMFAAASINDLNVKLIVSQQTCACSSQGRWCHLSLLPPRSFTPVCLQLDSPFSFPSHSIPTTDCLLAILNHFLLWKGWKHNTEILVTNVFPSHPLISVVSHPLCVCMLGLPLVVISLPDIYFLHLSSFLLFYFLFLSIRSRWQYTSVVLPWPRPSLHIKASLVLQLSLLHGLLLYPLLLTERCC